MAKLLRDYESIFIFIKENTTCSCRKNDYKKTQLQDNIKVMHRYCLNLNNVAYLVQVFALSHSV
jgi:hypothetical protein